VTLDRTTTTAPDVGPDLLSRLFARRLGVPADASPDDLARLPRGGGVVALATDNGALVQLLTAGSVRRVAASRLAPPADDAPSRRARLAGVVRQVWWQPAHSAFEAHWLYLQRARQLLGRDYAKSLGFGPVWYAALDLTADHPRWTPSSALPPAGTTVAGPFTTRKRCAALIADLEDLFDLCRYHEELVRAPHGTRCAYFDMGKCPAPCDGTVSLDAYRRQLEASAAFATTDGAAFIAQQQAAMQRHAANLAFERAQRCRDALARAQAAQEMRSRWARTPDAFRCLIVQRGARRNTLRPFFCTIAGIVSGPDVRVADVSAAAAEWTQRLAASDKRSDISMTYRSECQALVAHYLGKGEKASGVYLTSPDAWHGETVVARVEARFSRASRAADPPPAGG